jgi:hypothetical protein
MPSSPDLDRDARLHVCGSFVETGRPPTAGDTADEADAHFASLGLTSDVWRLS